jgi:hypothetical protein
MVCPLCEHVQEQGNSCDQCGIRLLPESTVPMAVVEFAGLEPTRLPQARAVPRSVASEPFTDLEPTQLVPVAEPSRAAPAPVLSDDPFMNLEPMELPPPAGPARVARASGASGFTDLEPTQLPSSEDVAVLPLPQLDRGREDGAPQARMRDADIYLLANEEMMPRCRECGLPGKFGVRCVACGVPIAPIEP